MHETRQISTRKIELNDQSGLKHFLSKKVLSKDGDEIGRIKDIIFDEHEIVGILVRKGFTDLFIDLSYVEKLFAQSIILKINPVTRYIGMKVYDADGKFLGKVRDIVRKTNTNKIDAIIIKRGLFLKYLEVPVIEIEVEKKNIILNKAYGP